MKFVQRLPDEGAAVLLTAHISHDQEWLLGG
jgi:hypothetical protein